MKKLGVNIDHIATLREVRKIAIPDPIKAALIAEESGADGITLHLREDRRHIQDKDVFALAKQLTTRMNLEMANTQEMVKIALQVQPQYVCLVPENRQEITTEGGLDIIKNQTAIQKTVHILQNAGISVSLFIDPNKLQIEAAKNTDAQFIEIHTGDYAEAFETNNKQHIHYELEKIRQAVSYAKQLQINVNAGHGLNYENIKPVAQINDIYEFNIGHAIIAESVFIGLANAVKKMKQLLINNPKNSNNV